MKFPSLSLTANIGFCGFSDSTLIFPQISLWLKTLSACSSLDTTLDAHLSSYPLALFFTDFFSLLHFARFIAVGGSCLAECLSSKRSFVFLQCYIIYTPAGFCPKYFLSGSGISILEVCPCHFKNLNIGLQMKYVDFCTKLKCLFTRYTLLLVRFLNF